MAMAQSNYAALAEGLKLYTDAMRRLIKDLLSEQLGDNWLDRGVLKELKGRQANNIRSSMKKEPDREPEDYLDAIHFPTIVAKRPATFEHLFPNYRQTQSFLMQAAEARNMLSAHSRSGDVPADDAGQALYVMAQLLERAELPEAEEVEALRKRVLLIERESAAPATVESSPRQPQPTSQASLPYWWETCEPREGFRDPGHVDEGLFAATLGGVFAGSARDEYLEPERFLSQTYFTENLTLMLGDVLSRMNGGAGAAVTEVQTPFGGGKTHALLTLYHIINSPAVAQSIESVSVAMGDHSVPKGSLKCSSSTARRSERTHQSTKRTWPQSRLSGVSWRIRPAVGLWSRSRTAVERRLATNCSDKCWRQPRHASFCSTNLSATSSSCVSQTPGARKISTAKLFSFCRRPCSSPEMLTACAS